MHPQSQTYAVMAKQILKNIQASLNQLDFLLRFISLLSENANQTILITKSTEESLQNLETQVPDDFCFVLKDSPPPYFFGHLRWHNQSKTENHLIFIPKI